MFFTILKTTDKEMNFLIRTLSH